MREFVSSYLNNDISRRSFIRKATAAGFSTVAAKSMLESLAPLTVAAAGPAAGASSGGRDGYKAMRGTGGEILAEQLAAAGARFVVVGNSSHSRGLYDALVDNDRMNLILATEEGQVVAIASGYAMASGKLGVAMMSVAGAPHASSNMYNAITARLPVLVMTDMVPTEFEGRGGNLEMALASVAVRSDSRHHPSSDKDRHDRSGRSRAGDLSRRRARS